MSVLDGCFQMGDIDEYLILRLGERLAGDGLGDEFRLLSLLLLPSSLSASTYCYFFIHFLLLRGRITVGLWLRGVLMRFFDIILDGEHIIVLDAVGECLDGHFRGELYLLPVFILLDEVVDVAGKTSTDLEMRLIVLPVLIEGEDIIDVIDQCRDSDTAQGHCSRPCEVLLVLLNQEFSVVEQESIELGKVFLLCHYSFIAEINPPSIMLTAGVNMGN